MRSSSLLLALSVTVLLTACEDSNKRKDPPPPPPTPSVTAAPTKASIDPDTLVAFKGLPTRMESPKHPLTEEKIQLGRMLYFESRISKNQELSCNSCHDLARFGADGEKTSKGHKGQRGARNAQTSLNAAGHFVQFWDGRAADVEAQALGPVLNPVEMAMPNEKAVVAVLESMPEYVAAFKKAFPDDKPSLSFANMGRAIGAFERTLTTPSRFDAFANGDAKALTEAEQAGFSTFVNVGCNTCHSGPYFGGTEYKKLGHAKPYPDLKDNGRFDVTKQETDRFFFKVPSLRNVEKTAPYFHDGSIASLEEAVKLMGRYQLGRELPEADVASIVVFMKALTGEAPKITKPKLPPSTPKTPPPKAD